MLRCALNRDVLIKTVHIPAIQSTVSHFWWIIFAWMRSITVYSFVNVFFWPFNGFVKALFTIISSFIKAFPSHLDPLSAQLVLLHIRLCPQFQQKCSLKPPPLHISNITIHLRDEKNWEAQVLLNCRKWCNQFLVSYLYMPHKCASVFMSGCHAIHSYILTYMSCILQLLSALQCIHFITNKLIF